MRFNFMWVSFSADQQGRYSEKQNDSDRLTQMERNAEQCFGLQFGGGARLHGPPQTPSHHSLGRAQSSQVIDLIFLSSSCRNRTQKQLWKAVGRGLWTLWGEKNNKTLLPHLMWGTKDRKMCYLSFVAFSLQLLSETTYELRARERERERETQKPKGLHS